MGIIYYEWSKKGKKRVLSGPIVPDGWYYAQWEHDDRRGWSLRAAPIRGAEISARLGGDYSERARWRFVAAERRSMTEETKEMLREKAKEKKTMMKKTAKKKAAIEKKSPAKGWALLPGKHEVNGQAAVIVSVMGAGKPMTLAEVLAAIRKADKVAGKIESNAAWYLNDLAKRGVVERR